MLKDLEGNKVELLERPNAHLLILGRSGSGKTYFSCRKIEAELKKGSHIHIFDFSASFTMAELERNCFQNLDMVHVLNPLEEKMELELGADGLQDRLVDSILKGLQVRSYYQKKLVREAIRTIFGDMGYFSMTLLSKQLERMLDMGGSTENSKNIVHLLNRIEPFSQIEEIRIFGKAEEPIGLGGPGVTVIQLSGYPESQRKFLVEFLAELFWEEVRTGKKDGGTVLFDEFQNIEIKCGSALSSMLREGRKFGLAVYLSTQFLGDYDRGAVNTLMQAANMVLFKPTEKDLKTIAQLIDPNQVKAWKGILDRLRVGEAVIKGCYRLNGDGKEISTPIICKI